MITKKQIQILQILTEPMTARRIAYLIHMQDAHVHNAIKRMMPYGFAERKRMTVNDNYKECYFYTRTEKGRILSELFNDH